MSKIHGAHAWKSNAELIADVARLGYLRKEDRVLDPTFEKGTWWKVWWPDDLVTCNRETDGSDFRKLDFDDQSFDAIVYDPPYVCPGGLRTSKIKSMHSRYGMNSGGEYVEAERDFRTPAELQAIINAGLMEMKRLVRPRGKILVKCKSYVWSGKLWNGRYFTERYAIEELGLTEVDFFEHCGRPGPQSQQRQVHARRNHSTLFIFERGKF